MDSSGNKVEQPLEHEAEYQWNWRQNIPLIVSFALSTFVVVRVLAIARFNSATAAAIVSSVGVVDVVLGVSIWAYSGVLTALLFASVGSVVVRAMRGESIRSGLIAVAVSSVLVMVFVSVQVGLMFVVLGVVGGPFIERTRSEDKRPGRWVRPVEVFAYGAMLLGSLGISLYVVGAIAFSNQPWLALEVISPASSEEQDQPAILGYVLDDSNGWVTILEVFDGIVVRAKSDSVESRVVCDPGIAFHKKEFRLLDLASGLEPPVPDCLQALREASVEP